VSYLLVVNPTSGGGKGARKGRELTNYLEKKNLPFHKIQGASLEDCLKQVETSISSGGFSTIVCVGGDGLVHALLEKIACNSLTLLVISAGTGNDFAKSVGLHRKSIDRIFKTIDQKAPKVLDLGLAKGPGYEKYFVQILSSGFDAHVNKRANQFSRIKGKIKYVVAVLLELTTFKSLDYCLRWNDQVLTQKAMLALVANGSNYGGGMRVCPHADQSDQMLDLMYVKNVSRLRLLAVFPRVFIGAHVNHPKIQFERASSFELEGKTLAFADGEYLGPLPVHVSIAPHKLLAYTA